MEFLTSCILLNKTATKQLHDSSFQEMIPGIKLPEKREERVRDANGKVVTYVNLTPDEAYVLDEYHSKQMELEMKKHEVGGTHYDLSTVPRLEKSLFNSLKVPEVVKHAREMLVGLYVTHAKKTPPANTSIAQLVEFLSKLNKDDVNEAIATLTGYHPESEQSVEGVPAPS